jgi:hypothetical protein
MSYISIRDKLKTITKKITDFIDSYSASSISFDSATHRISDSANGLIFLVKDDVITVSGSTSNNNTFNVTDGSHAGYIVVAEDLVTEIAGDPVVISAPVHVTHGDYSTLDKGVGNSLVLVPGAVSTSVKQGGGSSIRTWNLYGDLFVKFTTESETWENLVTLRSAIINKLEIYPSLDSTSGILKIETSLPEEPWAVMDKQGAGPFFLAQRILISVTERTALSGGEIP